MFTQEPACLSLSSLLTPLLTRLLTPLLTLMMALTVPGWLEESIAKVLGLCLTFV